MNQAHHHHHQQQQQQPGTALLYTAGGQPVTITVPAQPSPYEAYRSGQSRISGVILIVLGVVSIALNAIGIGVREVGSFAGYGFGSGVLVSKLCYASLHLHHGGYAKMIYRTHRLPVFFSGVTRGGRTAPGDTLFVVAEFTKNSGQTKTER